MITAALLGTGCELITAPDRSLISGSGGSGGTGGSGGSTASGGTTSSSTSSSTGECAVAEDCPDPGNECLVRTCSADKTCTPTPTADGTPVKDQTAGDCQVVVCDGAGATKSNADDADVHVDGKECTADMCDNGVPSNPPVTAGTACGAGGALFCNDAGVCVGCLTGDQCGTATDCSAPACNNGTCGTTFTAPGTPIPMQTAGDCQEVQCDGIGGTKSVELASDIVDDGNACTLDVCNAGAPTHPNAPSGTACADGGIKCNGAGVCVACLSGADCPSGVCAAQVCAAPGCMDGVKNGPETDKDCGGGCPTCADGKVCSAGTDCTSKVCTGNVCQVPACNDGVKNGNETDLDCGGSCATKCGPGLACNGNADCKGGTCTGNTCVPTCTDGVKNGTESDVDCGGSCAAKCANTKVCNAGTDCSSTHCSGAPGVCVQCVAPTDCPATNNECIARTCNANVCGTANLDQTHTLSTGQTSGDCQKIVCNGAGGVVSADDPTDLPVSNTICLINPACSGAPLAPSFTPAAQGTDCTADNQPPKKVCGGGIFAGVCVGCNIDADCTGPATCVNHVCTP